MCSAEKNGKTDVVVQQTRHHSPLANISPSGHIIPQPPRHAQLIRSDPCSSQFQNAIHQRSDELDVNPRSVAPVSANPTINRAAANPRLFQKPRGPRLRLNRWFAGRITCALMPTTERMIVNCRDSRSHPKNDDLRMFSAVSTTCLSVAWDKHRMKSNKAFNSCWPLTSRGSMSNSISSTVKKWQFPSKSVNHCANRRFA